MERDVLKTGNAIQARASSPTSIWISIDPLTANDSQNANQNIRRQAAKASAKARLQTISRRAGCRKLGEGRTVWALPPPPSSPARQTRNRSSAPEDDSSPFGLLYEQRHADTQASGFRTHDQQMRLFRSVNILPVHNDFRHLVNHCGSPFSLPCVDANTTSLATFRT